MLFDHASEQSQEIDLNRYTANVYPGGESML